MNKNNFTNSVVINKRKWRLLVKYRNEFASMHGAYAGGIKPMYPFIKNHEEDLEGLIDRVCNNQRTHYMWAWLFENNPGKTYSDVIRAWDENGFELTAGQVQLLNKRRKNKLSRK